MGNAVYPRYKAWKANGVSPAAGYYLYTYVSNSTVPKATYSDGTLETANANPIVLDSNGEATIFLSPGDYRFDLKTPGGALINTFDPVNSSSTGGSGTSSLGTVESIAALRLLTPPAIATSYQVLGYYAVGDFGGGLFYFNPLSAATDDGGYVIRPSTNPTLGRWLRLNDRPISVKFWGWVGSGAPVDATAIAAMLAYTTALVNPDYYHIPGQLTIYSKQTFQYGADSASVEFGSALELKLATSGTQHIVLAPAGVAVLTTTPSAVVAAQLVEAGLGIRIDGAAAGAPAAAGTIIKGTVHGLDIRGITGSSYDLTIWDAAASKPILANYAGGQDLAIYGKVNIGNVGGALLTLQTPALTVIHNSMTGTTQASLGLYSVLSSACTLLGLGVDIQIANVAGAYTMTEAKAIRIQDAAKGAGSAITTQYGLFIEDQSKGTTNYAIKTGAGIVQLGDILMLIASSTARATLNIPSGTAPTSPVSGDCWYDGTNLKFRDGGTTRTITWT